MNKEAIEAQHATRTEHKVVFYIEGKKYGFRCDESFLNSLNVEEGAVIPYVDGWGVFN